MINRVISFEEDITFVIGSKRIDADEYSNEIIDYVWCSKIDYFSAIIYSYCRCFLAGASYNSFLV